MPRKPPPIPRRTDQPPPDPLHAAQDIVHRAKHAGFALAGISSAQPSQYEKELREWLLAGRHGDMEYLTQDLAIRLDPTRILEGTKSFIVVADVYSSRWLAGARAGATGNSLLNTEGAEKAQRAQSGDSVEKHGDDNQRTHPLSVTSARSVFTNEPPASASSCAGRIARYARGKNYHDMMKRRLHTLADQLRIDYPGSEFRTCVDTAPVNERELATLAGLGWQAKNTLVINPKLGSYMLLGVVATTLELTPSLPRVPDSCGTCTRCIDACPTQAISPYSVDARRCISYLTIEHRGVIDPQFFGGIGDWIFGCDVCQEVCPHNSPRPVDFATTDRTHVSGSGHSRSAHDAYSPKNTGFDLLQVLGWSESDRRDAFTNSPMKRATLAMMKRNALIALGNKIREIERGVETRGDQVPGETPGMPSFGTFEVTLHTERARLVARSLRGRISEIAANASEAELTRQTAAAVLEWLGRDPSETPR